MHKFSCSLILFAVFIFNNAQKIHAQAVNASDSYIADRTLKISFTGGTGNPKDWIGIYNVNDKPGKESSLLWFYVDGTKIGNNGNKSNTLIFNPLPVGSYKAYLFENDGYAILASDTFIVQPSNGNNTVELPNGVYFQENFDGVILKPFESDSESGGDGTDWSPFGPDGWLIDKNSSHGATSGGETVKEFDGWTFIDPVSWNATAGQDRSKFTKGKGVIAVADSDEFDDKADAKFNSSLTTPIIDISAASKNTLILKYDSSWRKEPQSGSVTIAYNGGEPILLLNLDENSPDALNETIELELNNPANARTAVITWNYSGHNNWWWAIDNIKVITNESEAPKKPLISVYKSEYTPEENVEFNFKNGPGNAKDMLILYKEGQLENEDDILGMIYVDGTEDGIEGVTNGDFIIGISDIGLMEGNYAISLFGEDSNRILATASFKVASNIGEKMEPEILLSKTEYEYGESIVVNFSGGNNAADWVGIYNVNDIPGEVPSRAWLYVDGTKSAFVNKDKGELFFDNLPIGNYKVYFLEDNGYKILSEQSFKIYEEEIPNRAPVVLDGTYEIGEDSSIEIELNGSDQDNDSLEYRILVKPKFGSIYVDFPNVLYTPKENFFGQDTFTYIANDGSLDSNISTIVINIYSINDPPAVNDINLDVENKGQLPISLNGNDVDGDELNYEIIDQPKNGILTGEGANLTYEPKSGHSGIDLFTYRASDGVRQSNIGTVKVNTLSLSDDSWTILIYGHGDHNLSLALINDMLEMEKAGSSENFNIVVQADFNPKKWNRGALRTFHNDIPVNIRSNVSRFLMQKNTSDSIKPQLVSNPIEIIPEEEANMDDPEVLKDFIDWGLKKYPADRYGLIFWNHGNQWRGYGGDKDNGTKKVSSVLKSSQINEAVRDTLDKNNKDKLDFISFDTCLMGGVEVLVDFWNLCDVFIACSEIDYQDGWDYNRTLNYLKKYPNIESIDFAKREVEFWDQHHSSKKSDKNFKTHSAYDMSKYQEFNQNFKIFAEYIYNKSKNDKNFASKHFPELRRNSIHYDIESSRANRGEVVPTNYIDLGLFAREIGQQFEGDLKTISDQLADSIDKMVIAKSLGVFKENASGLSIYYPFKGDPAGIYEGINFVSKGPAFGGDDWVEYLYQVKAAYNKDIPPVIMAADDSSRSARNDTTQLSLETGDLDWNTATPKNPAALEFTVVNGEDAYEAYAFLVAEWEENNFTYLGEIASGKLDGKGDYYVEWNSYIPVISLAESESKSPLVYGADELQQKELQGTFPLYMGGWAISGGSNMQTSLMDYQAPNSSEIVPLVVITEFDENGIGTIDTILEDKDTPDTNGDADETFEALSATSTTIDLEPGGKLWPVYYEEEWDSDFSDFTPWLVRYADSFLIIPDEGINGINIDMKPVESGDYSVEVYIVDYFNNYSNALEFPVYVPDDFADISEHSDLNITINNNNIQISWPHLPQLENNIPNLQWNESVKGVWENIPFEELSTFENDDGSIYYFYQERVDDEHNKFFRLIYE